MIKMTVESYNSPDFNIIYFENDIETATAKGERLLKLKSVTKVEYEDMGSNDEKK